jgi:hypothetical protein
MAGWVIAGIIYFLGAVVFFKASHDSRWLRATLWPLFLVIAILFS